MKPRDVIPKCWLVKTTTKDGIFDRALQYATTVEQRASVRANFDGMWFRFCTLHAIKTDDEICWFESTSRAHAGLALVRDGCVTAYKAVDFRTW